MSKQTTSTRIKNISALWQKVLIALLLGLIASLLFAFGQPAEAADADSRRQTEGRGDLLVWIGEAKAKLPKEGILELQVHSPSAVDGQAKGPDSVVDGSLPDPAQQGADGPSVASPPSSLIARLPMDDQYHSQLTETSRPNACGPTSLLMVLDYFELEDSLAAVIAKHEFSPAQGGFDPSCTANPVCTSPGALVRVAQQNYGLEVEAYEGWTFDEIAQSLAAGRPVIADIVWGLADEGPGHFVVIFGIDMVERTITFHDPYDGANRTSSWEDFAAAWDGPVDRGDPLQPEGHRYWGMSVGIE